MDEKVQVNVSLKQILTLIFNNASYVTIILLKLT